MNTCKDCKYWGDWLKPEEVDKTSFSHLCGAVVNNGNPEINGFATTDPAGVITGADFGCVKWEQRQLNDK